MNYGPLASARRALLKFSSHGVKRKVSRRMTFYQQRCGICASIIRDCASYMLVFGHVVHNTTVDNPTVGGKIVVRL